MIAPTKSQRKAIARVTGFGALPVLTQETDDDGALFVKVGSKFAPLLFAISRRGKVWKL